MKAFIRKVFQRKSEIIMFLAGISIILSIITVATTGNFIFWKLTKFFYMLGVLFIIFDN